MHRFWDDESQWLGLSYGVMVALQFLVLPVLVRIRVRQLEKGIASAILFLFPYVSLCRRQKHAFMSWITGDLAIVKKCMQYKNKVTKHEKGKPIFV